MTKKTMKAAPVGGSAHKKHPRDFTHMAVALGNPASIQRWVDSNFPSRERQA